jgi:sulfatase maturation enzyme AslB (radical SAM superfamily)
MTITYSNDNALVKRFVVSEFPETVARILLEVVDELPNSCVLYLIHLIEQPEGFRFESIASHRIAFCVLRILQRIYSANSFPLIYRGEIELTHKCNLSCAYCNDRRTVKADENRLDYKALKQLLTELSLMGCRYMHFNGGEVTLLPELPKVVAHATSVGMRDGISSNGTGPLEAYKEMVASGLSFAHISFYVVNRS